MAFSGVCSKEVLRVLHQVLVDGIVVTYEDYQGIFIVPTSPPSLLPNAGNSPRKAYD